jgi:outer membrane protein TolC
MENNLKVLAGLDKNASICWKVPEVMQVSDSLKRIEFELYEQNRERADAMIKLQNKRYMPRLYAYGQAGYSYPGLNFFENDAATYYIVGARLSWQIFDWQQAKKDKQLISLQKEQIDISEADFNRNLSLSISAELEELNKLQQLIDDDQKIIAAKEAVTKASASALDNGSITTADYLNDLNSELKARFDYERHKISLSESNARLAVLRGINVEQL